MANGLYEGKDQFQRDEAIRSASLASMTLMLAANEVPVMLIAVGRAAAGNWPRKVRRSIDEVLSIR